MFGPPYRATARDLQQVAKATSLHTTADRTTTATDPVHIRGRRKGGRTIKKARGDVGRGGECDDICWWKIRSMVSLHVSINQDFRSVVLTLTDFDS